jgi:hypothetical protein
MANGVTTRNAHCMRRIRSAVRTRFARLPKMLWCLSEEPTGRFVRPWIRPDKPGEARTPAFCREAPPNQLPGVMPRCKVSRGFSAVETSSDLSTCHNLSAIFV